MSRIIEFESSARVVGSFRKTIICIPCVRACVRDAQELNVAIKDLGIKLTSAEEKSLLITWDKNGDGQMVCRIISD